MDVTDSRRVCNLHGFLTSGVWVESALSKVGDVVLRRNLV
jgi:hypothetical protein